MDVIGTVSGFLDNSTLRYAESPVADFTCDAVLGSLNSRGLNVSGCFLNGGAMRSPLTGNITMSTLQTLYPYNNNIVVVNVSGTDLIDALEHGVGLVQSVNPSNPVEGSGRFPQVGGLLKYAFNASRPAGQKILLALNGYYLSDSVVQAPVDPCAFYRIATTDYLVNGGDNYTQFHKSNLVGNVSIPTIDIIAPRVALTMNASTPFPIVPSPVADRILNCDLDPKTPICQPNDFIQPRNCSNGQPVIYNPVPVPVYVPVPSPVPTPTPTPVDVQAPHSSNDSGDDDDDEPSPSPSPSPARRTPGSRTGRL